MELEERVAMLEAETVVLRRYVRALISLLPKDIRIDNVLAATVRTINLDARNLPQSQAEAWSRANAAIGALGVPSLGLLAVKSP